MAAARYANLSDDELRELASAELTDAAWIALKVEFRRRGCQPPKRSLGYASPLDRGGDSTSISFSVAAIALGLIVFFRSPSLAGETRTLAALLSRPIP